MLTAQGWEEYELLDASDGRRLERWGGYTLVRPDPQVIWKTPETHPLWKRADAIYHRSGSGGGSWESRKDLPKEWEINWDERIRLLVTPTGFKHTGIFPEQAVNWKRYESLIRTRKGAKILNLFGYTGAATAVCLAAGASVCHVDASRGMVAQAKRNAALNGLADAPARYLVDDCAKFVAREIRRGNRYDGILMDPPSYGRGPSGEIWRMEEGVYDLVKLCAQLLSEQPLFFTVNSYTTGLAPSAVGYVISSVLADRPGRVEADEIGIYVKESGLTLPCGSTAMFIGGTNR